MQGMVITILKQKCSQASLEWWRVESKGAELWGIPGSLSPLYLEHQPFSIAPRLHPDSQGQCLHLTNDGLSYEQTELYEHFGARAPS